MEYTNILKQAYESARKHKAMWFLGMLVASGGANFSNVGNFNTSDFKSSEMDPVLNSASQFMESYWWVLIIVGILFLLLMIVMIVLHNVAIGGLYYGAEQARLKKKVTFGDMFRAGSHTFWKVLGTNLLIGAVFGGVGMLIAIPLAILAFTVVGLIVVIPAVLVLIVLAIPVMAAVGVLTNYAFQYMTLRKQGVIDSLKMGWLMLKNNVLDSFVMFLFMMLVGIGFAIVSILIAVFIILPFAIIGFIAYNSAGWVPVITVVLIGLLVLWIVMTFIKGIRNAYTFNVWHLTFVELEKNTQKLPAIAKSKK
ncbi:MAG: hypothetical protein Q8P90_04585 [bacterium]|nr:hypothetical protein [bacterium]